VAIRETQRRHARVRESFARRDDVWLVRMPAESMKHRDAAEGTRVRQVQRSYELAAGHDERDALQSHSAGAGFIGTSGIASSSKTFCRSSIGARELMSSSTFLRPFILPMRIAPTSLSPRKKRRL